MSEAAISVQRPLPPEDQARSEFYALLARLFADAPDGSLLAAIAAAPSLAPSSHEGDGGPGDGLAQAWGALKSASAVMEPEAARDEYQTLFVGVGRSEVSLYASHYLGPQSGRPLAQIRGTLAELGLARRADSSEYEDHLAVVLETMRMLVAGDSGRRPASIAEQQAFFERHVGSWVSACCDAISANSVANYYRRVAQFADRFLALERDSFAVED
jgi:TorA maturation chaperone TorD